MPIYHMKDTEILPVESTTFEEQGLKERQDLQRLLKKRIEIISENTLIVAEEFCDWEDSRRRIDLLGIDKDANLVVIELKRSQDGHMDLQAIRYAAMISTLTFDRLIQIHSEYLEKNGIQKDARDHLLEFLAWPEPDEERFGKEVKIVLALASGKGFSKELTTAVMWLNDFNLDIKCVHLRPYQHHDSVLLDVRSIIPLPETAEYQVSLQKKERKVREFRSLRDHTKYNLTVGDELLKDLNKNRMMWHIVSSILSDGTSPKIITDAFPGWGHLLFEQFEGELFHHEGNTYALSNQWGSNTPKGRFDAIKTAQLLKEKFPNLGIEFKPINSGD